jgi:signal transduction histidine kinase
MSLRSFTRSAASGSFCVRLPEFFHTTAFRWALGFAAVFAAGMLLLSGFIYWQTVGYLTRRVDNELLDHARAIARAVPDERAERIRRYLESDVSLLKIAGLFASSGAVLAGNLEAIPPGLPTSSLVGEIDIPVASEGRGQRQSVRVVVLHLAGGGLVVLGRSVRAVEEINEIVTRALLLALLPAILLALIGGVVLSKGAVSRIAAVHRSSRLIMAGRLGERLPIRGRNDDFDKLARIVNEMLDEIERLMSETKGVGEDIAHDLRTPLTRLRGRIEGALTATPPTSALATSLGLAIEDIDQLLGTIAAILRIAEVEHGQRRAGFRDVDLNDVLREAVDLYEPTAEEKGVVLTVVNGAANQVRGDGDLLFEAVANLLDNAIKFTPARGRVEVSLGQRSAGPVIRVADNGPGIPSSEFKRVLRRFHRGDRSRNTPGAGLGLSLVAAIVRLHGYGLVLHESVPGCCMELECWPHETTTPPGRPG